MVEFSGIDARRVPDATSADFFRCQYFHQVCMHNYPGLLVSDLVIAWASARLRSGVLAVRW